MKPILRFTNFDNDWEKIELLKIASEISYGMNAASKEYDGENKYIRITDIDEQTNKYIHKNIVSPDGNLEKKFLVKENDILFARTGASTGKTYLYDKNDGKLYYAGFLIKANIINHNANFIFQQTKLNKYNNWVKIMSMRSGQPGINSQEYGSYKFSITSPEEENKVSNFLSLLDKKIELQTKKIEDLKLFTKNTISNELNNLQNYNISKFKDICNIQTGKSNTQDKCDDGIYPFYIRSENIERSNNYIFDCEAVLTIGDGNIGKVFFYENGKFDCHQRVYVLNNFKNVLGKYVYYYFSSFFYKRAMSMSAKNTVDSVRMEMISDMIIKVPQEKEQIKMINLFSSLDKKLELEQNKLDKLQELKKGLMQNMFV